MRGFIFCIIFATFTFSLLPAYTFSEFICGASVNDAPSLDILSSDVGVSHVRLYLMWKYIQTQVKSLDLGRNPNLNNLRDQFNQNPQILKDYAMTLNWNHLDQMVTHAFNHNIQVIGEIGEGTKFGLPSIDESLLKESTHCTKNVPCNDREDATLGDGNLVPFDPILVSKETYLPYIYRYARAVVQRYSNHNQSDFLSNFSPDAGIFIYQIENELNEAYLTSIIGWRKFKLINSPWNDWNFLTEILRVLHMAVKDECSTCQTTMNFHTDLPKLFHELIRVDGFYLDALKSWHDYMDIISIDGYPNYYTSNPLYPEMMGDRIAAIRKVLDEIKENDKPVIVMESGYPVSNISSKLPPHLNFTQEHQYEYILRLAKSIKENKGNGLIYFSMKQDTGVMPPPGGYTQQDDEAMHMLSQLYHDENILSVVKWLSHPSNISYMMNRMGDLAGSIEKGWGLRNLDGSYRLGMEALKKVCQGD